MAIKEGPFMRIRSVRGPFVSVLGLGQGPFWRLIDSTYGTCSDPAPPQIDDDELGVSAGLTEVQLLWNFDGADVYRLNTDSCDRGQFLFDERSSGELLIKRYSVSPQSWGSTSFPAGSVIFPAGNGFCNSNNPARFTTDINYYPVKQFFCDDIGFDSPLLFALIGTNASDRELLASFSGDIKLPFSDGKTYRLVEIKDFSLDGEGNISEIRETLWEKIS